MKRNLFLVALGFILCYTIGTAQVNNFQLPTAVNGDGTDPHPSAMLDVKSTDKGMLVPRVANASTLVAPGGGFAEGLLVYQTGNPAGFYYYDGASWKLVGGADNLGDHTATQPIRLVNLTTGQRDLLTPEAGMEIYNTDNGRPEFYQVLPPMDFVEVIGNGVTQACTTSVAQSFKPNSSFSIIEIMAKIDFGATVSINLKIREGEGIGGTILHSQDFVLASTPSTGNDYTFLLDTPLPVTCCGVKTFEITPIAMVNAMDVSINFQDAVSFDVTTQSSPDPYTDGKFYCDGVNNDIIDGTNIPILMVTSRDLDFKIVTQRIGWVTQ